MVIIIKQGNTTFLFSKILGVIIINVKAVNELEWVLRLGQRSR